MILLKIAELASSDILLRLLYRPKPGNKFTNTASLITKRSQNAISQPSLDSPCMISLIVTWIIKLRLL